MKLNHGLHLAYCTNIHRGESWAETFEALKKHTLAVRDRVAANKPYAIGLRLSQQGAQELSERGTLLEFQRWLKEKQCYVFTINGFPYGQFHGTRVKERVYLPDWTSPERVAYTNSLFDLLAKLLPAEVEGSVSTVPCGFKELVTSDEQLKTIRRNIWECVEHIARVSEKAGRKLHLGLEPEPLCVLETSGEAVKFFEAMREEHPGDTRLAEHLGVNYDTCHLAVEFEEPGDALGALMEHGIKISKLHLSSALKVKPTVKARAALAKFADDIYLHQVIVRRVDGSRVNYRDLGDALAGEPEATSKLSEGCEWRIHFHVPLHSSPTPLFDNTTDHLIGALDILQRNPRLCSHLEMETYTWEVLPPELRSRDVVEQLVAEYEWTLAQLAERGLCEKR
jgi:sugar phosphate isomerase/epimerase